MGLDLMLTYDHPNEVAELFSEYTSLLIEGNASFLRSN